MWTDQQLDNADYVAYHDRETKQFLNVGTVEVQGSAYQGPYLCVPVPPFGSLKNGDGLASIGHGVHVPGKRFSIAYQSQGFPSPHYQGQMVLHNYTNGDL